MPRLNMTDVTMTKLRKDPAYIEYYMFWAKLILLELIPYIVIFTLNAVIISRILDSRRFRTKMAQVQQVCSSTTHTHFTLVKVAWHLYNTCEKGGMSVLRPKLKGCPIFVQLVFTKKYC